MTLILRVNPTGMFSYGISPTIELDCQGIVQLTGINHDRISKTANGSGKSSLFNIVCHLIFGENPVNASDTEIVNEVLGKGCWGKLEFDAAGKCYRVVMTRKWKQGRYPDEKDEKELFDLHEQGSRMDGTDLYFSVWNEPDHKWLDIRGASAKETRAKIIEAFGMSYRQFMTTSYLAQDTANALIKGKNSERMKIITELTDMSVWDRAVANARERVRQQAMQKMELKGRYDGFQAAIASMYKPLTAQELEHLQTEIALKDAAIVDENDKIRSFGIDKDLVIVGIRQDEQTVNSLRVEREAIDAKVRDIDRDIAQIRMGAKLAAQQVQRQNQDGRLVDIAVLETRIKEIDNKVLNLAVGVGVCPKCYQTVTDEHINSIKGEWLIELDRLRHEHFDLCAKANEFTLNENARIQAEQQRLTLEAETTVASLQTKRSEAAVRYDQINQSIGTGMLRLADAHERVRKYDAAIAQCGFNINAYIQIKNSVQQRIDSNTRLIAQIEKLQNDAAVVLATMEAIEVDIRLNEAIIKGMGDKGIKAFKFGAIIATLNELVAEYMRILSDGQVQVWFSPWREKAKAKNADDIVAEIQIFVKEGPKEEVDLKLYSGAERQQITLAIVCAFWRLATMQGGGTNILLLDEMLGPMDEGTSQTAINLINKLRETHFGTIIVVTHSAFVKDQLPHDHLWTAEKRDHITHLYRN